MWLRKSLTYLLCWHFPFLWTAFNRFSLVSRHLTDNMCHEETCTIICPVAIALWLKVLIWTGVAVGAGWQSIVVYVNLGCYYLVGIPFGLVLGYVINLQVEVSFHASYVTTIMSLVTSLIHQMLLYTQGVWIGMLIGTLIQTLVLLVITIRTDWEKQVPTISSFHLHLFQELTRLCLCESAGLRCTKKSEPVVCGGSYERSGGRVCLMIKVSGFY